jgi:hypothetical protein
LGFTDGLASGLGLATGCDAGKEGITETTTTGFAAGFTTALADGFLTMDFAIFFLTAGLPTFLAVIFLEALPAFAPTFLFSLVFVAIV